MKYYIGLDVSMKETFLCCVDENGKIIYEGKEKSDPTKLSLHIKKMNLNVVNVAIESGSISNWLVTKLKKLGIPAICVDARHMSIMLKANINKTDKNDARAIALTLKANMFREVILKKEEHIEYNTVLGSRKTLVKARVEVKNSIRGHLKSYGIKSLINKGSIKKTFEELVKYTIKNMSEDVKSSIGCLLSTFKHLNKEIESLDNRIRKILKREKDAQLLTSMPGVGPITALRFLITIGNPNRFEKSETVGAYCGLTPNQYSSGETVRMGHISKKGPMETRSLLVEAATVMLTRTKSWSKPKAWAMNLSKKKGLKKAIVALARKMSIILHRMLVTKKPFRFTENDKNAA